MATEKRMAAKKKAVAKARKKPGGSNVGKFLGVKKFAGPAGGAPERLVSDRHAQTWKIRVETGW